MKIFGVRVDLLSKAELHETLAAYVENRQHALVLNVNVHCLNLSYKQPWLRNFLNRAEIVFCDGAGVMLGGRLLGYKIPERITYADWMWQLAAFAEEQQYSLYFLGAKPGVAARAANNMCKKHPNLRIVGEQDGYFDKTINRDENKRVVAQINLCQPNILVLGFGMPLQEKWLMENWDQLNVNIALTGGAVFDYLAGDLQRAPKWMTDNGFEWFGRLVIEPRRLWRRYIVGNPLFLWRVLKQRFGLLKFE